jgi:hypothetical protein
VYHQRFVELLGELYELREDPPLLLEALPRAPVEVKADLAYSVDELPVPSVSSITLS